MSIKQEEEGVILTPEELQAKIATLEKDKENMSSELAEDRKARRELTETIDILKEQLKSAAEKNNQNPEDNKILSAVETVLSQKEKERGDQNRKVAFDKFVAENREYHPDNDPSGLKRMALEKELSGLNQWSIAIEVDDLVKVIGKANTYLRGSDTSRQTENEEIHDSTPRSPISPTPIQKDGLSPTEIKLIERNGFSKEYYLKLKAKMPDFIEGLLDGIK